MGIVRFFTKADTWLDVTWRWGSAFATAWIGLTWVATKMSRWGDLNWAEAVFIGLGAAMALSVVVSLALIAIRFFRPILRPPEMPPPSASTVQKAHGETNGLYVSIANDISGLKRELATLRSSIEHFARHRDENAKRTKLVESAFLPVAAKVIGAEQAKLFDEIETQIASMDRMADYPPGEVSPHHTRSLSEGIQKRFSALGVSPASLSQATEAARNEIEQNNEYVLVRENEKDRWASGSEKKDWHKRRALQNAYRKVLTDLRRVARSDNLISFVEKTRDFRKLDDGSGQI